MTERLGSVKRTDPSVVRLFGKPVAFSPLLDEIPVGLVILDLDRRVAMMNRSAEALTGMSRDEARGLPCRHVVRSNLCLQRCPLPEMSSESEPVCLEGDIISRDRERIPVRTTFAPLEDPEGRLVGFLEALEDLRMLQALDASKGRVYSFGQIIGRSSQMQRIYEILPGVAQTDSSVLVTGETGTGKDLLAEAIHQASGRAKGPFVKVNCGALPESLLESELFGHEKGAFTGAGESKPGRFRLAHNGTLFLTEIGDLPLTLQVKLLTFLDDHVIYPLGSTKGVRVDVRIIAATHRDLKQMVREGRFREDLLFRLNVVRLHIPPLRERGGDVRLLLDHFLRAFTSQFQKPIRGFTDEALERLMRHPYPGNVRELRNIVEYAVNLCNRDRVGPDHLPPYLLEEPEAPAAKEAGGGEQPPVREQPAGGPGRVSESTTWMELERRMILEALLKAKGRRSRAAEILGWGRSTLWRKMKRHGIDG
ncbi:sigma-54 interaction domain-containing protein [Desulfoglaeba alkanexedens]|uniref:PAS domain-containing protein n=1 Tax=Desulfoglaeba alkanexedens ALDC TaxID=980445 RepID=A0A4P8L426_9BACT|nr:sigma 54-interacting transcriptional regulator [Desulfoglaeba alkanexedens]QCQ21532.1 PAS domain-containing protein [Desulfoglaeba alkanexedens ALDC]